MPPADLSGWGPKNSKFLYLSGITLTCDLVAQLDLLTKLDLFYQFWEVSIQQLQLMWHANRGRLFLETPVPVSFWTFIVLMLRPVPLKLPDFEFRTSLGTSILWIAIDSVKQFRHRSKNLEFITWFYIQWGKTSVLTSSSLWMLWKTSL